jgi:glutamate-1-semialdehyde 2,1-aminomutase
VATAAGLATLQAATDDVYARLDQVADALRAGVAEAFTAAGLPHVIQSTGSMFSVFLTDPAEGPVSSFAEAQRTDVAAYGAFFHAMLDGGVHLPPSAYEAWFVSSSHDDRAVDQVLDALPEAAKQAASRYTGTRRPTDRTSS